MRPVWLALEVVVPQTEQGDNCRIVSTTTITERFKDVYWNVFLIKEEEEVIIPPNNLKYSLSKFEKVLSMKEMLLLTKQSMTRILTLTGNGTGFYILPQFVITNQHVSKASPLSVFKGSYKLATTNFYKLPHEVDVIFSGYYLNNRNSFRFDSQQKLFPALNLGYQDPIATKTCNFGYLDVSIHRISDPVDNSCSSKVLFIPCPTVLQINDEMFTVHYPGLEGNEFTHTIWQHEDYIEWAPNNQLASDIFHQFGKLCVSTGKVIAPYIEKVENDKILWVPNNDLKFTTENSNFILSNESVMYGSSGGCVQSNQCEIIKVGDFTLVEFHGIHFGGEFIKCQNCLKNLKQHLKEEKISWAKWDINSDKWGFCKCEASSLEGLAYNYSVSVHHPLFKDVYKQLILPELLKLLNVDIGDSRIERLRQYLGI
ncbi:hypothetical protein ABK040_011491 [Willaertia magna]